MCDPPIAALTIKDLQADGSAMSGPDPAALPLPQRLALTYAPAATRAHALALMALDNRLAGIIRQGGEPVIAQIKLAWWRDRLGERPDAWPGGEPLLAALRSWPGGAATLVPLVDGWEGSLAEDLTVSAIEQFANGRAAGWAALAPAGSRQATLAVGRQWALADLARNLGQDAEAGAARRLAMAGKAAPARLPRAVRPLAVLRALTWRALERDSAELLDGAGALFVALRAGLTGR